MITKIDAIGGMFDLPHHKDIGIVIVPPGAELYCSGRARMWRETVAVMVKSFGCTDGRCECARILQVLQCPFLDFGQDWCEPDSAARKWACEAGARRVTIRGGIKPLTAECTLAVPDFVRRGSSWYIVDEALCLARFPGIMVHYQGLLGCECDV